MNLEQFQDQIQELATAVEEDPPGQVEPELPEHGERTVGWILGLTIALLIGGFAGAVVWISPRVARLSTSGEVTALVGDTECARGMAAVVDAITAYARDHGGPPPQLADLSPTYLPEPPLDPVSTKPYAYTLSGTSIALSCPKAEPRAAEPPKPRREPG